MSVSHYLRGALWSGLALVAVQSTYGQVAATNASENQSLETVVVTGSMIKRTDAETPSPVQVISEEQLQQTGYTNVADVLRNLSVNGQGTLNQSFSQAFAAGASGIALRGLTVGDTLTLIDSERMVSYPLSDDGERSFVDVTAIPFNAIESIEVLKDGASAIYGADAIAGVVNIKLRKSYQGAELTAEGGTTEHGDGTTEHFAAIMGTGDLANDGYNVYVALDYHHQDKILGSARHAGFTQLDWSNLPGGQNTNPGAIGATGLVYPDSTTGYLINPGTASGQPYAFLPGCTAALQAADKCTFAFPGQIQNPSIQANVLSKFTKALAGDWSLTFTGSIFDSQAQQVAATTFGHALSNTGQEAGSIENIIFPPGGNASAISYPVLTLPANSYLNPFGKAANLVYSFPDLGPYVVNVETVTYRFFTDLHGTAAGWDLDGQIGLMYARMAESIAGNLEPGLAQAALDSGAYIPGVSTNGTALFAPVERTYPTSTLGLADVHASRELFELPGGPLSIGIGGQYFHKAQNVQDPPSVTSGVQEGTTLFTIGSQDDTAAFAELDGKVVKNLEVNAAVRYDHYNTYGSSTTPKFGVKYQPIDMLALRATWGKGFRAPSIAESGTAGLAFGEGNINDPVLCPGGVTNVKGTFNALCAYPAIGLSGANPTLKAVTSTNETFGFVFEPLKQLNLSADYYRIRINNDIISASAAGGLGAHYIALVRGPAATLAECTNTTTGGVPCTATPALTPVGYPAYELIPYVNAGITTTSGIDIDLRGNMPGPADSKFTAEINYTHMIQYEYGYAGTTFDLVGTHGPTSISGNTGNPRDRAVASLTWDRGPLSATISLNYIGPFSITDPSAGYNTCLQSLIARSPSAYGSAISPSTTTLPSQWYQYCDVKAFYDTNLQASYTVTDHFQVHGSILNLFNVSAPVDLQTYGGGAELAYDAAMDQDGAVGRFFMVGATYRF